MTDEVIPRRSREPDNVRNLAQKLDLLTKQVEALAKNASLRNASISGGDGLTVYDGNGNLRLRVATNEGAVIAYDAVGSESARYGLLKNSSGAGQYGIETRNGSAWTHVVGGVSITWNEVSGKPTTFAPSGHQHGGADIVSQVAAAAQADGSSRAFNNTVGGNQFYAVWVGNDGNFNLGRNTSSLRYKHNVRDFDVDLSDLLRVRPVLFDYNDKFEAPTDPLTGQPAEGPERLIPGAKDQYGFVAEELVEVWPEVITYFDHGDGNGPVIDGIRYDLVAARLVPALKDLLRLARNARQRVVDLEAVNAAQELDLQAAREALVKQNARLKALEDRLTKAGL